jgi:hypothetical protein
VTTYRVGNHWGVTIVREAEPVVLGDNGAHGDDQLVAVVVNGSQVLAERICRLLNADEPYEPPTCGCPVARLKGRIVRHVRECPEDDAPQRFEMPRLDLEERADIRRRVADRAEHRPSSLGDGLGYGPCVGCGELWPCKASRVLA